MKRSISSLVSTSEARDFEIRIIPVESIKESPTQARSRFEDKDTKELAESIKANGILQPLVVQVAEGDTYKLIAGERRLRAAKHAGLEEVPCVTKDVSERDAAIMGLVENVQREDLGPIEEAVGYKKLIEKYALTIKQVGNLVGKSRSYVSNSLRLVSLDEEIIKALQNGSIKVGQARPLLSLDTILQKEMFKEIITMNLSSRDVEERVGKLLGRNNKNQADKLIHIEQILENFFGRPVKIKTQGSGGKIEIPFKDSEDLINISDKLN